VHCLGDTKVGTGPVRNVAKTPLAGGQWIKGQKHKFDLAIVNNQLAPGVPVAGPLKLFPTGRRLEWVHPAGAPEIRRPESGGNRIDSAPYAPAAKENA
jgi:hypothetical protein